MLPSLVCLPCGTPQRRAAPCGTPLSEAAMALLRDTECALCTNKLGQDSEYGAWTGEQPGRSWVNQCINDHYVHKRCLQRQLASGQEKARLCSECSQPVHVAVVAMLEAEASAPSFFRGIGDLSYRDYTAFVQAAQTSYVQWFTPRGSGLRRGSNLLTAHASFFIVAEGALQMLLFGGPPPNSPPSSGGPEQRRHLNTLFDILPEAEAQLPRPAAEILFGFVNQGIVWLKRDAYLNERIVPRPDEPSGLAPLNMYVWNEWDTYPPIPEPPLRLTDGAQPLRRRLLRRQNAQPARVPELLGIGGLSYDSYTEETERDRSAMWEWLSRNQHPLIEHSYSSIFNNTEVVLRTLMFGVIGTNLPLAQGSREQREQLEQLFSSVRKAQLEMPAGGAELYFAFVNRVIPWLRRDDYMRQRIMHRPQRTREAAPESRMPGAAPYLLFEYDLSALDGDN